MRDKRQRDPLWGELGRTAALGVVLAAVLLALPLLLGVGPARTGTAGEDAPSAPPAAPAENTALRDAGEKVRLLQADGSVETLTMADYLFGVVAAEMPASFELEALKAQACAARTYAARLRSDGKHDGADLCGDSGCCQAYLSPDAARTRWGRSARTYEEKLTAAVAETDGLGVLSGGKPIQAVFFSSAPGQTVDAAAVWGGGVDYLKSVSSPEGDEVPNYHTQVEQSADQVRQAAQGAYPAVKLSGDPAGWFGPPSTDGGGTVLSQCLGGVTLTGSQLRQLFSLRSAAFTVAWDGSRFVFSVTGYGHGVGMSQYGANAMAKEGKSFRDILTWYYSGTEVGALW